MSAINWEHLAREAAKSGHALLGPSTLPRLFRCSGSLRLAIKQGLVDRETAYSIEGSQAHYLADMTFASADHSAFAYKGVRLHWRGRNKKYGFTPDQAMCEAVQEYVDWCDQLPGDHFFEQRVFLNRWMLVPFQFGTSDHAAIHKHTLTVTDLKYGMGEEVLAEENEQAMAYALGFWDEWEWAYDIREVVIRICQPRLGVFDEWKCSIEHLLAWGEKLRKQMEFVMGENARCVAGKKQCLFCPVSGNCETERLTIQASLKGEFVDFDADDPSEISKPELMSLDDLSKALEMTSLIRSWLKKIEARGLNLVLRDKRTLPAWKAIHGRRLRRYTDEQAAAEFLLEQGLPEEEIVEKKLISPAQAEKKLPPEKRKELAAYWEKPPGRPKLVPESAKGEPYTTIADEFDAFDEIDSNDEGDDDDL